MHHSEIAGGDEAAVADDLAIGILLAFNDSDFGLLLTGNALPKSQIFDVTKMKSIRNGVVCDIYYYCDICAIRTVAPGPCVCCQAPVELVEKPLESGKR